MVFEMLPTKQSPHVVIDHVKGYILIKGIFNAAIDTIAPKIIDEIKDYLRQPQPFTLMEMDIKMYPESRRYYFLDLFRLLEKHFTVNREAFLCKWHSGEWNDKIRDDGELFATIIKLNFELLIEPEEEE